MAGAALKGTRADYGTMIGGVKDMQTGAMSNGGPAPNPRAQKPIKGGDNSSTVKVSASEKTTRKTTG